MKKTKLLLSTVFVLIIQAFFLNACSDMQSPKNFNEVNLENALIDEHNMPEGFTTIMRSYVGGENPKQVKQAIADDKNYIVISIQLYDDKSYVDLVYAEKVAYLKNFTSTHNHSRENNIKEARSLGDNGYVLGVVISPPNTIGFLLFQRCNTIAHFDMEVDTQLKFDKSVLLSIAKIVDDNLKKVACQ